MSYLNYCIVRSIKIPPFFSPVTILKLKLNLQLYFKNNFVALAHKNKY